MLSSVSFLSLLLTRCTSHITCVERNRAPSDAPTERMMAEKPRPASPATAAEQEGALAAPAPAAAVVEEKKLPANPEKAVEALEERLKDLGGPTSTPPAPTPAQSPAPAPTAKAAGGGKSKSALMVSFRWD